jgi:predicted cupin superfamily sugar epimerase
MVQHESIQKLVADLSLQVHRSAGFWGLSFEGIEKQETR